MSRLADSNPSNRPKGSESPFSAEVEPALVTSRYSHYHALDGEVKLDCEACLDEWIRDLEAGGATHAEAVRIADETIQNDDRVWWMS